MLLHKTKLVDVFEIEVEPHWDDRGFFARSWCKDEFEAKGLNAQLAQCSISFNMHKGTLRGIHYQAAPHPEIKVVRCTRGGIFDVAVDLRPKSPTYKQWIGVFLTAENRRMLYVPEGCGHGFLTLETGTEVSYQISESYHPELARGVRWDDQAFGIEWPDLPTMMSDRDRTYPDFQ